MLKFALKTVVYAVMPTAFARVRSARAKQVTKAERTLGVRQFAFAGTSADETRKREYASYDQYVEHQGLKYSVMLERTGGNPTRALVVYRTKFWLRFRRLGKLLPKDATIVCAGARDGTEVEVWRDLGYTKAVGYDLNPGPGNSLVREGDFNHLPLGDASVDAVYSNCVDHAFDLDMMFTEARRILKPGGFFLYDISLAEPGAFEAVEWDRPETALVTLLRYATSLIEVRRFRAWMQITARR